MEVIALIGFGEAGQSFAAAAGWAAAAQVFDIKTDTDASRDAMLARYAALGVSGYTTSAAALEVATAVLSLVTADQALAAATATARHIATGAFYFDMNSVAPQTKGAAAATIEAAGGRYVDVAIMAPVNPAQMGVPLLLSGASAEAGAAALADLGFTDLRVIPGDIGRASAIKMIRSVMIKGIEALTAECLIAADAAGVTDDVLASLGADWPARADYNLDRMLAHGLRRAAEMQQVAETLDALGTGSDMARATALRQFELGRLGIDPPVGLSAKLAAITKKARAA